MRHRFDIVGNAALAVGSKCRHVPGKRCQRCLEAMRDIGREMRQDAAFAPQILGDVQIAGIERWEHFGVFLRCRMKVLPEEQWRVRAEFMRRLKIAFEQRGIQSP